MQAPKQRLLSLDFFRGITVAAMILVNNPGSWGHIYAPLKHADWHGCTPTDLVFPFFLFIVGVSIAFSMGTAKLDPSTHKDLMKKAVIRGLKLYFLGFFLAIFGKLISDYSTAFQTVRLMGVLQRIGIVFIISTFIFLKSSPRMLFNLFIGSLFLYWVLMNFVPVPGIGYANLEKETNLAAWVDRLILTEPHIWASSKTWDPEGILSTLPAVATTLMGILVGQYLRKKEIDAAQKVSWLFTVGTAATILGLIWDLQFPINKSLWTSSYVLYTGGLATIGLAFCYWLIDIQGYKRFTKAGVVYGVNAITVFFLSGFLPRVLNMIKIKDATGNDLGLLVYVNKTFYMPYFSPLNASLLWAISFIVVFYFLLLYMYKKNIIIKV